MESEKTIDGGWEIRYAARIVIKARVREQYSLGGAKHCVYTLEVNLEAWKPISGGQSWVQFCRPVSHEDKAPIAGMGDDERIIGEATYTETTLPG